MKLLLHTIAILTMTMTVFSSSHAQWVQTNGPYGDIVLSLAVSGPDLFANTTKGIFRSTDCAASWSSINPSLTPGSGYVFAAAFGNRDSAWLYTSGWRSSDNGVSWSSAGAMNFRSLAVSGRNLFASSWDGIFLSRDSGKTWVSSNAGLPLPPFYSYTTVTAMDSTVYAGVNSDIYRTTDDGANWVIADSGMPPSATIYRLKARDGVLYAALDGAVYSSTDRGISWSGVGGKIPGNSMLSLAVYGDNVVAGTTGAYHLAMPDTNWIPSSEGIPSDGAIDDIVNLGSSFFAATFGGGIYRSTDGGATWVNASTGLWSKFCRGLFASGSTLLAEIPIGGIYRSTDKGQSWPSANAGLTDFMISEFNATPGRLFAGSSRGLFVSSDTGEHWTVCDTALATTAIWSLGASGATVLAAGPSCGIFRSTDGGFHWMPSRTGMNDTAVTHLATDGAFVLACTSSGSVYLSTDTGSSWRPVSPGITSTSISALHVVDSLLYIGTSDRGIFRSSDRGSSWNTPAPGSIDSTITGFASVGTSVFMATAHAGVFCAIDGDTNWTALSVGLPSQNVYSLTIADGELYAAIPDYGVWRRSLSDLITSAGYSGRRNGPDQVRLEQNYPNPFNPATTIRFSISLRTHVRLTVFNTLGQRVAELVNGDLESGYHEVTFDGRGLASGMYLYRIQSDNFVETRKFLLLR